MKQLSGKFSEIELIRSDSAQDEENRGAETSVRMNSREWDKNCTKVSGNVWRRCCSGRRVACERRADDADQNSGIKFFAGRRGALLRDGDSWEDQRPHETRYGRMAQGAIGVLAGQSGEPDAKGNGSGERSLHASREYRMGRTDASMILGRLPPSMRPLAEAFTQQCGLAVK